MSNVDTPPCHDSVSASIADLHLYGCTESTDDEHSVQPRMQLLLQGYLVAPIQCPEHLRISLEEAVDELEQVVSMTYSA
jgi:hypothetical protein